MRHDSGDTKLLPEKLLSQMGGVCGKVGSSLGAQPQACVLALMPPTIMSFP